MADFATLIAKHASKGVLLDANLLVLHLVGRTNRARIERFKRTQAYTVEDFDLLERLLRQFAKLFTTPHVLTEASNLSDLHGKELLQVRSVFRETVEHADEFCEPSAQVVADPSFARLGLTDSAIASIARRDLLVLTADLDLQLMLDERGLDVINFNHIRPLNWH
jgi:hypothetical protein